MTRDCFGALRLAATRPILLHACSATVRFLHSWAVEVTDIKCEICRFYSRRCLSPQCLDVIVPHLELANAAFDHSPQIEVIWGWLLLVGSIKS